MEKLRLPTVTLVMVTDREPELASLALQEFGNKIEFGDFVGVDSIADLWDPKTTIRPCTSHVLITDWTGWVLDPSAWSDEFLDYDYIGAPWRFFDRFNVGSGTFSLRSTRLLDYLIKHADEFPLINRYAEDDLLCRRYRPFIERAGFRWAPPDVALRFAFDSWRPANITHKHFGFSGIYNWPRVLEPEQLQERVAIAKESPRLHEEHTRLQMLGGALITYVDLDPSAREKVRHGATALGDLVASIANPAIPVMHTELKFHDSIRLIREGDFERGFAYFDATRFVTYHAAKTRRDFTPTPQWAGQPLKGKTILLWMEWGYGDLIIAQRFFRAIEEEAERVYWGCPDEVVSLLEYNSAARFTRWTGETVDYHCPALGIPFARQITVDTLPGPMLRAKPLAKYGRSKPRIGLCWAGNPVSQEDITRSLPLSQFIQIVGPRFRDATFIALSRDMRKGDEAILEQYEIERSRCADIGELASLVDSLDLVFTSDGIFANLAGELRKPTFVLCRKRAPDWRWGSAGPGTIWFPTVTVLRQENFEDWSAPISHARDALIRWLFGTAAKKRIVA